MGIYIWIFVELYRAFFKKHYGIDTFYTAVKINLLNNRKILFQLIFHKVSPVFHKALMRIKCSPFVSRNIRFEMKQRKFF